MHLFAEPRFSGITCNNIFLLALLEVSLMREWDELESYEEDYDDYDEEDEY